MKKLFLLLVCTIGCTQQIHSMKRQIIARINSSNESPITSALVNQNNSNKPAMNVVVVIEPIDYVVLSKHINPLSEKLYDYSLNEQQIESLVKKGALVNYKSPHQDWPIPIYFAFHGTPQGIKNMAKIIELGAKLHKFPYTDTTPLLIAAEWNYTEMIQLLLPYEKTEVTVYKNPTTNAINNTEKRIRDEIIYHLFHHQNLESIKLLLKHKLITPNQGLNEFFHFMKPNQDILNFLTESGANNHSEVLNLAVSETFPDYKFITFLEHLCAAGAFDENTLKNMHIVQKKINNIVQALEKANNNNTQSTTKKNQKK